MTSSHYVQLLLKQIPAAPTRVPTHVIFRFVGTMSESHSSCQRSCRQIVRQGKHKFWHCLLTFASSPRVRDDNAKYSCRDARQPQLSNFEKAMPSAWKKVNIIILVTLRQEISGLPSGPYILIPCIYLWCLPPLSSNFVCVLLSFETKKVFWIICTYFKDNITIWSTKKYTRRRVVIPHALKWLLLCQMNYTSIFFKCRQKKHNHTSEKKVGVGNTVSPIAVRI